MVPPHPIPSVNVKFPSGGNNIEKQHVLIHFYFYEKIEKHPKHCKNVISTAENIVSSESVYLYIHPMTGLTLEMMDIVFVGALFNSDTQM